MFTSTTDTNLNSRVSVWYSHSALEWMESIGKGFVQMYLQTRTPEGNPDNFNYNFNIPIVQSTLTWFHDSPCAALMLVWPMSVPHLSCTKATRVSKSPKLFLSRLALSYLLLLDENVLDSHYFWVRIADQNIRCYSLMTTWSLQYEQRHAFLMYTEYLGTRVETDSNFCGVQK